MNMINNIRVVHVCDVIKQNESKVDNDMLLVSYYFYTLNSCEKNVKQDTCGTLKYQGLHNIFIRYVKATMHLRQVPGFNSDS